MGLKPTYSVKLGGRGGGEFRLQVVHNYCISQSSCSFDCFRASVRPKPARAPHGRRGRSEQIFLSAPMNSLQGNKKIIVNGPPNPLR